MVTQHKGLFGAIIAALGVARCIDIEVVCEGYCERNAEATAEIDGD